MQVGFAKTSYSRRMPTPIPIELIQAGRDITEPKVSPDGSTVAFVARWRGAAAIMVVPIDGGPEQIVTTGPDPAPGRGMGGGCFAWHPDGHAVVYAATDGELWWQEIGGASTQKTTLGRICSAPVMGPSKRIAWVVDEAEVWFSDKSGVRRIDDGTEEFCFDPAVSPDGSEVVWQAWNPPSMPWDTSSVVRFDDGVLTRWRPDEASVQQPRFMPDGRPTWVDDSSGWLNVYVDGTPVLPEPFEQAGPQWGMGQRSHVPSPDGTKVAFCRNEGGFGRLCVVDLDSRVVTNVGKGGHGQLGWHGNDLIALRTGAVTPTQIVRYDVSNLSAEVPVKPPRIVLAIGPAAGWSLHNLPEPHVIETERQTDDGPIALHARRYVAGNGRMLCWVHGGPTDQWQADFRPRISYWWSRGWDVLVVDPRGTTGHGREFQQALNGGWGRIDVDDTAVLIEHAHSNRWATPQTTAVIGGSSGGLTVLGVLADHPDLVAGGVASYPVSDLKALAAVTHRFEAHYTDTLVCPLDGTDAADERFRQLSPLYRAGNITAPLLLFHGTDDPVVPVGQSEALVEAITSTGGSVDFVVYEGEGHGFRDADNVRDEYDRTEQFLNSLAP